MKQEAKIRSKSWLRLVCIALPLVSLLSYILPFAVKGITNKLLRSFMNYYGHTRSIRISLFPCRCIIRDFHFDKVNPLTQDQPLFFSAEKLELKFEWKALWNGILKCDIEADAPDFTFVKNTDIKQRIANVRSAFDIGFPVLVKTFEVREGMLEYMDQSLPSTLELKATGIHASGSNISNIVFNDRHSFTEVSITGNVYGGEFNGTLWSDLVASPPAFELKMEVQEVDMVQLNSFFEAYGKFDVSQGTLGLFTEISASEGEFSGYVKPFIKDLDIFGEEDMKKPFFRMLWEGVVGTVADVFTNVSKEQLATKIKFKGSFGKMNVNIWYAVLETLRNAFVRALKPSFELGGAG